MQDPPAPPQAIAAIDGNQGIAAIWLRAMAGARRALEEAGASARDAVVLVPQAVLLPVARRAWLAGAPTAWMPRFETVRTLTDHLGPPLGAQAEAPSGDAVLDALQAERRLVRLLAQADWAARLPVASLIGQVVEAAHGFLRVLQACAPPARGAWLDDARARMRAANGPGAEEMALARFALEWAAQQVQFDTDRLFGLEPSAWVMLQAGAPEALTESLGEHARARRIPVIVLDLESLVEPSDAKGEPRRAGADAPAGAGATARPGADVVVSVCADAEEEAQRCADAVLRNMAAGRVPIGLVAEDRQLVRRVRALLEACGVSLHDETGWKLSTTRMAAALMATLRAARPRASSDEWLDWLKACEALAEPPVTPQGPGGHPGPFDLHALPALESAMRRTSWWRAHEPPTAHLPDDARALWQAAAGRLAPLTALSAPTREARQPLSAALRLLAQVLRDCGLWPALEADEAGRQLLTALRLDGDEPASGTWEQALQAKHVDLEGLIAWVDSVLETRHFQPVEQEGSGAAPVVMTPLARAVLRPFAAIVMPAVDELHLGGQGGAPQLVGEALAAAIGLPGAAARREAQWRQFRALLRLAPRVHLLRRRADEDEPLAPSPWLERLTLERRRLGQLLSMQDDERPDLHVTPRPPRRPAPAWPDTAGLPRRLSAAGYERLRACPYRFHAQDALGLRAPEELDDSLQRHQIGTWLHRSLQRFHDEEGKAPPRVTAERVAHLLRLADEEIERGPWLPTDLLPERADLPELAQAYVDLLEQDEAAHWQVVRTEATLKADLADLAGSAVAPLVLEGRIDRLDVNRQPPGLGWRLVDYKTTDKKTLQDRVREPEEDTQLAFYAALLQAVAPSWGDAGPRPGLDVDAGHAAAPRRVNADAGHGDTLGAARPGDYALDPDRLEALYLSLRRRDVEPVGHPRVADSAQHLIVQLAHDITRLRQGHPAYALGEPPACERCDAIGLCRRPHWPGGRA